MFLPESHYVELWLDIMWDSMGHFLKITVSHTQTMTDSHVSKFRISVCSVSGQASEFEFPFTLL